MASVMLDITRAVLEHAVKRDCRLCPLALAAHNAGYPNAVVYTTAWLPHGNFNGLAILLPPTPRIFMYYFDTGRLVVPQTIELPLDQEAYERLTKEQTRTRV